MTLNTEVKSTTKMTSRKKNIHLLEESSLSSDQWTYSRQISWEYAWAELSL